MQSKRQTRKRNIQLWLVAAMLVGAALMTASTAQAAALYAGNYTAVAYRPGVTLASEPFTDQCLLGPITSRIQYSSGNNELGTEGIEITFDLGQAYVIDAVRTEHVFPNEWWSVGELEVYRSDDGIVWEFVGSTSDGYGTGGWRTRRVASQFEAQYVRLNVRSRPYWSLLINQVIFEVPPEFMPVSTIQIDGLEGARHFIWMESENADFIGNYVPDPCDPCDPCDFSGVSGSRSAWPQTPSCLWGDLFPGFAYSFTNYTLQLPADFENATLYKYYGSLLGQGAVDNLGKDISPNINTYLDFTYLGAILPESTVPDPEDPCAVVVPVAWTDPFSLGSLAAGGHNIKFTPRGFYNPIAYDGILITEGSDNVTLPDSVIDGDWTWRPAPYLDPNTGLIGGTTATATVTVAGPVEQGYIRVDDELVQTFSDPGVFLVPISGMGDHLLEVETFAYPFDPCLYDPCVFDPCNLPTLRGRVLAGASFRFTGCSGEFLTGDLNEDCYVNLGDFVLISNDWMYDNSSDPNCGVTYPLPAGDADENCIVNMVDAALLSSDWLQCNDPCGPCP
ncbi:MAG: discoidin domain-containing protein [Sedimentisphaerales bacterium]|nr:discoidin domain-containing protein [Sedimentisphaerales bacterium]